MSEQLTLSDDFIYEHFSIFFFQEMEATTFYKAFISVFP